MFKRTYSYHCVLAYVTAAAIVTFIETVSKARYVITAAIEQQLKLSLWKAASQNTAYAFPQPLFECM